MAQQGTGVPWHVTLRIPAGLLLDGAEEFGSADVAAVVLQESVDRFHARNLQITGPEAITYAQVAEQLSFALDETIDYIDMTEEELSRAAIEAGFPEADLELQVLCHFRQIRNGNAELVTDTYREIIGRPATSVQDWAKAHRDLLLGEVM